MFTRLVVLFLFVVPLFIYDVAGIYYLLQDIDYVHGCKASNQKVHVIWPTDLAVYIILSIAAFTIGVITLIAVQVQHSLEVLRRYIKRQRHRRGHWNDGLRSARYGGGTDDLPDWLFMLHGTVLIVFSMVVWMLSFMGYFELFAARPWCNDKRILFEELDLWHFGRTTFVLQIALGVVFFLWGTMYWVMPFVFEAMDRESRETPSAFEKLQEPIGPVAAKPGIYQDANLNYGSSPRDYCASPRLGSPRDYGISPRDDGTSPRNYGTRPFRATA